MLDICDWVKIIRIIIILYIIKRMYLVLFIIFSEESFNIEVFVVSNQKNINILDKFRFVNIRYWFVYICIYIYIYKYLGINRLIFKYIDIYVCWVFLY